MRFPSTIVCGIALAASLLLAGGTMSSAQSQGGHGSHGTSGAPGQAAATPQQQGAAAKLVADVKTSIGRWSKVSAGEADGFRQNNPFRFGTWGPAHFGNATFSRDGVTLDPQRPEGLVYMKLQSGEVALLGAIFKAPKGEGPRPGGPLTEWHSHECATGMGNALRSVGGQCPPGTTMVPRAVEMLHVWTFDNPDGPFAHGLTSRGIEAAVRQFSVRR
jgi:hypothetical protein